MNTRMFVRTFSLAAPIVSIVHVMPAHAGDAEKEKELARYFHSSYSYCDAKVLAAFWGQDMRETKARIGRKIGWADFDVLDSELRHARDAVESPARICPVQENGYSYEDMEALSSLWGERIKDTKVRASRKLVWGDKDVLDGFLKDALRKSCNTNE